MCLIVDANAGGEFLARGSAVREWLLGVKGNPRLVAAGKLLAELAKSAEIRRLLAELNRAGRLRSAASKELAAKTAQLQKHCRSNDVQVIALAVVTGARTLATHDDDLVNDFKDGNLVNNPRGRVYRHPLKHKHLLAHTPSSCGVRAR